MGIEETNAGIDIPASIISVRYRVKNSRTALAWSGTGPFPASLVFHSGTGLVRCRTVWHSGIYTHELAHEHALTHACRPMMNMDRNMDVQHRHEAWTWRWTSTLDAGMPIKV
jgi:hypothetical protein